MKLENLHEQFTNNQFTVTRDEELANITGGTFILDGVTYSSYQAFYNKYGDLWNCLTGN